MYRLKRKQNTKIFIITAEYLYSLYCVAEVSNLNKQRTFFYQRANTLLDLIFYVNIYHLGIPSHACELYYTCVYTICSRLLIHGVIRLSFRKSN